MIANFLVMKKNHDTSANEIQFVRDGFSIFAFAVPVVWLLWHRLWLQAALCFAAFGLCAAFIAWNGTPVWIGFSTLLSISIGLVVALEGGEWRRQSLERGGFHETALISANSVRQAEELYASGFLTEPVKNPMQGFAPVSATSLIPLTGSR